MRSVIQVSLALIKGCYRRACLRCLSRIDAVETPSRLSPLRKGRSFPAICSGSPFSDSSRRRDRSSLAPSDGERFPRNRISRLEPMNYWVGTRCTASGSSRIKSSDAVERVPTGFMERFHSLSRMHWSHELPLTRPLECRPARRKTSSHATFVHLLTGQCRLFRSSGKITFSIV